MRAKPYPKARRTADDQRKSVLTLLVMCTDERLEAMTPAKLAHQYGLSEAECASMLLQARLRRSL